jgi:uncharacterized phage protein (TIGR01671 family)
MREYKFRAWDRSAKRMYHVADMSFGSEGCLIVRTTDGNVFTGLKNAKEYELMQYTGLKDKNGKEIYEGDILKDNKGKVYEIVWGHDLLWLAKTNEKQGNCYCPKGLVEHGAVVAGNRWDNPELMKEGSV